MGAVTSSGRRIDTTLSVTGRDSLGASMRSDQFPPTRQMESSSPNATEPRNLLATSPRDAAQPSDTLYSGDDCQLPDDIFESHEIVPQIMQRPYLTSMEHVGSGDQLSVTGALILHCETVLALERSLYKNTCDRMSPDSCALSFDLAGTMALHCSIGNEWPTSSAAPPGRVTRSVDLPSSSGRVTRSVDLSSPPGRVTRSPSPAGRTSWPPASCIRRNQG